MIGGSGASMEGKYRGVAPGCSIISVKVLDHRGNGYASDVLSGLRWIRSHKEFLGIRIVNISVGSLSKRDMTENSALVKGVNAAWDDGLVVVVAAGNHGPGPMTVTTPGISRKVITVGCSDDHKEVEVMGTDGRLLWPWPYCQLHLQAGYRSAGMRDRKLRERGGSIFCQIRHQYVYAFGIRSHCPFAGKIPRYDQPGCKTPPQRTGHRSGSSQKSAGMGGVGCAEAAAVGAAEAIPSRHWGYGGSVLSHSHFV